MTEQLKSCPFCGAQPKGPQREGGGDERNGYNFSMRVSCQCGATISKPSREGPGGWCDDNGQAKLAVIAAWNARA